VPRWIVLPGNLLGCERKVMIRPEHGLLVSVKFLDEKREAWVNSAPAL
jgi:hypothetical protein